jgi:hypothetical protein
MTFFALGVPENLVARVNRALEREGLRIEDYGNDLTKSLHFGRIPHQWLDVVEGVAPADVPRVLAHDGPVRKRA